MHPNKKVLITFFSFLLALVLIACSCSSLIPSSSTSQEALPGLAGTWRSTDTDDIYEIAWQDGQYEVLSATYNGTAYNITSQSWANGSLTWSYYDTDLSLTVTLKTTSLSGDTVYIDWSVSDGSSGSSTLTREQ